MNDVPEIFKQIHKHMNDLEQLHEKCHDLYTWLPISNLVIRYHGEYYTEYQPSPQELVMAACDLIGYLAGYDVPEVDRDMALDEPFECFCGDFHIPGQDDHDEWSYNGVEARKQNESYRKIHEFAKANVLK